MSSQGQPARQIAEKINPDDISPQAVVAGGNENGVFELVEGMPDTQSIRSTLDIIRASLVDNLLSYDPAYKDLHPEDEIGIDSITIADLEMERDYQDALGAILERMDIPEERQKELIREQFAEDDAAVHTILDALLLKGKPAIDFLPPPSIEAQDLGIAAADLRRLLSHDADHRIKPSEKLFTQSEGLLVQRAMMALQAAHKRMLGKDSIGLFDPHGDDDNPGNIGRG